MRRFTVVCDDRQARRVERLASQYDLTEREVLRQLLEAGLESLESDGVPRSPNGTPERRLEERD